MRSEDEIRDVYDRLGQESDPDDGGKIPAMDWSGDTFKYGFLVGKLVALGWVLGDRGADMGSHYDYEDWRTELRSLGAIPGPTPPDWRPPEG